MIFSPRVKAETLGSLSGPDSPTVDGRRTRRGRGKKLAAKAREPLVVGGPAVAPGPLTWASVVQTTHCILRDLPKDGSQLGPKSDIPGILSACSRQGRPPPCCFAVKYQTHLGLFKAYPGHTRPECEKGRNGSTPGAKSEISVPKTNKKGIKPGRRFLGL